MLGIPVCFLFNNHNYVLYYSYQLIEEVGELKAFKTEQSQKISYLEYKLVLNTMLNIALSLCFLTLCIGTELVQVILIQT